MQYCIGTGQAYRAADDLFALLQGDARSSKRLFGALGLLGHGLRGIGRYVPAPVFFKQRCTEGCFQATDRAEYGRYINLQQIGGTGQCAAANQGEHQ